MERTKALHICNGVIMFSLCATAYFIPISKALIEGFSGIAILGFLIKKTVEKKSIDFSPVSVAVLLFLFVCLASFLTSTNCMISARVFFGKTLQEVLLFFTVADTLRKENGLKKIIYALLAGACLVGIDGISQVFTRKDFIRNRHYACAEEIRICASFYTANDLGTYLCATVPFALLLFLSPACNSDKAAQANKFNFSKGKPFLLFTFCLLFVSIILTSSRGAWFSFAVSLIFTSLWVPAVGILIMVILLLGFLIPRQFSGELVLKERLERLFVFLDQSSSDRKIIWQTAWNMFIHKPWLGVGLATFMFNFKEFTPLKYNANITPYAHNCYLQMAAELGIIGLVVFLSIVIIFFSIGNGVLYLAKRSFSWYVLLASLAAVVAYSVGMVVDTALYSLDLGMLFWLVLGIGVAATKIAVGKDKLCTLS